MKKERRLVQVLELQLDRCANTFSVAPCTATGVPCFNKFGGCKDVPNFIRVAGGQTLRFVSRGVAAPLSLPLRPYVISIDTAPTEIKPGVGLAIRGQQKIVLADEPDNDSETDPYLGTLRTTPVDDTFPPTSASDWTTYFGTHSIFAGTPPPPLGTLIVLNTNGTDFACSFKNSTPSNIRDSVQHATMSGAFALNPRAQGVFLRATLTPGTAARPPNTIVNGYWCDWFWPVMRIIRMDSSAATVIASLDLTGVTFYGTSNNQDVTFNVTSAAGIISFFLSHPGQANSATLTASAGSTTNYPTGRIGLVSFGNNLGAGMNNFWQAYSATFSL